MENEKKPKKLSMDDVKTKPQPRQPPRPQHHHHYYHDHALLGMTEEEVLGYTPGDQ
jgi:hypothetical protein